MFGLWQFRLLGEVSSTNLPCVSPISEVVFEIIRKFQYPMKLV